MPRKAKIEIQDVKDFFGRAWSGRGWASIYGMPVRVKKGMHKGKFYVKNFRGKRWIVAYYEIRPLEARMEAWNQYIKELVEQYGKSGVRGLEPDKADIKVKKKK